MKEIGFAKKAIKETIMAGRKPQPTALKLMKGVAKERLNLNEPEFAKVTGKDSAPPDYLVPLAAGEWRRIFPELKKTGILTKLNRNVLAGYCAAYANWREVQDRLNRDIKSLIPPAVVLRMANQALESLRRYASEFGLTPSSQSRIIAKNPADDESDRLLAALMGDGGFDAPKT